MLSATFVVDVTFMILDVLHIYPPTSTKFLSPINADCFSHAGLELSLLHGYWAHS